MFLKQAINVYLVFKDIAQQLCSVPKTVLQIQIVQYPILKRHHN